MKLFLFLLFLFHANFVKNFPVLNGNIAFHEFLFIFLHIHLDKRNSTGNLYFSDSNTNQPDHPLSSLSNTLQQGSARILRGLSGSQPVGMRDSTSSLSSMNSDYDPNDPQAMVSRELRTAAGLNFTFFYTYKI